MFSQNEYDYFNIYKRYTTVPIKLIYNHKDK